MSRFVIHDHDWPVPHKDLMLEHAGVLLTWRLPTGFDAKCSAIPAEQLPDHRLAYLDYSGPVSGDRGTVIPWDHGTLAWIKQEADQIEVRLLGIRLQAVIQLRRVREKDWLLSVSLLS